MPNILDKSFKYTDDNNAASHSDPDKFRERMDKYREMVKAENIPQPFRSGYTLHYVNQGKTAWQSAATS